MEQFRICRVRRGGAGSTPGFVVVLQRDLMVDIGTRLVAPLVPHGQVLSAEKLHPRIDIEGVDYVVMIERMAAVHRSTLVETEHRADSIRDEIVRAVDFLITG